MPKLLLAVLAVVAVPCLAGTAVRPKQAPVQSDRQIQTAITEKFARSKVAEDRFTVRVQNGVAILEGSTNVMQRKGAATRMAKSAGAVSVDNRIRVSEEAKKAAAQRLALGRKRAEAKREPRSDVKREVDAGAAPAKATSASAKKQAAAAAPRSTPPPAATTTAPKSTVGHASIPASTAAAEPPAVPVIRRAQVKH